MNEWDTIATSFDSARKQPWEECLDFIRKTHGTTIDIGCGNARHLIYMAKEASIAIGLDSSYKMMLIAKKKIKAERLLNTVLILGSAETLPLRKNMFDHALFIAALHNIKGRENRIQALSELRRVLKPEGTSLISVWSKWQDKYRTHFIKNIVKGRQHGDIMIPWKKNGLNVTRLYHLYSLSELRRDLHSAHLTIKRIWGVKKASKKYVDNYFAIVTKK